MPAGENGATRRILAATDLSARADRALRRAAVAAAGLGARLTVLHVVDDDQPRSLVELERHESWRLLSAQLAGLPELAAVPCQTLIESGDPYAAILRAAEREGAACLVMGEHRRGGLRDLFTGTTVERVLRRARCPVLMVRQPPAGPYRQVVVATDFSPTALRAGRAAYALRLLDQAAVTAVHALEPPRLGALGDTALPPGAREGLGAIARAEAEAALAKWVAALPGVSPAQTRLCEGAPGAAIAELLGKVGTDLLVVGTRGAGLLREALLGSVATELLAAAPCDVLAVPPG